MGDRYLINLIITAILWIIILTPIEVRSTRAWAIPVKGEEGELALSCSSFGLPLSLYVPIIQHTPFNISS